MDRMFFYLNSLSLLRDVDLGDLYLDLSVLPRECSQLFFNSHDLLLIFNLDNAQAFTCLSTNNRWYMFPGKTFSKMILLTFFRSFAKRNVNQFNFTSGVHLHRNIYIVQIHFSHIFSFVFSEMYILLPGFCWS